MKDTIHKTVIGVAGPVVGYGGTMLTAEQSLKILSLVIGCAVGMASFISICFSIQRKYRNWKSEKTVNPKDASLFEEESTTL